MAYRRRWWVRLWAWVSRKKAREFKRSPFREFIYLDEISVISLLVSREGELTEQIQEGRTLEESAGSEIGSSLGAKDTSISAKSTFQTKSSQSVQATRKANIQSQFRRLLQQVIGAKLLFPQAGSDNIDSAAKLLHERGSCIEVSSVVRGTLLELDVKLRADPVFSMGSIVTEVASMSEEHPDVFGAAIGGLISGEMKSMGKLLDRFMAGLVPIRSVVTNVRLYETEGKQYLVEADIAKQLNLTTNEIELVGVLERDRFWKDMRRVLFSDASMTVLGRVGIDGLHDSWTPVKLLDLFKNTIPGGQEAVAAFQNINFDVTPEASNQTDDAFHGILQRYAALVMADENRSISEQEQNELASRLNINRVLAGRSDSERQAFQDVTDLLAHFGFDIDPERGAELREQARSGASIDDNPPETDPVDISSDSAQHQLVEVEVIAMYW